MHAFALQTRDWAARIKRDGVTLWFASKHPATPWYSKALGVFVGYVDDVLLLPAPIWLAVRMIPASTLVECRSQADDWTQRTGKKPTSRIEAVAIVTLWIAIGVSVWYWWSRDV